MTSRMNRRLSLIARATKWFSRKGKVARRNHERRTFGLESLETRRVFTTTAILDFTGGTITAAQMNEGGWSNLGEKTATPFRTLFTNANPGLDFNGSGSVNSTDANIAIERIVAKVRAQYAPYNIGIFTGDHSAWHNSLMNDSDPGDGIVMITGSDDFVSPTAPAFGWAPMDLGNEDDQYAFSFAKEYIDAGFTGEQFINAVARTTSHELAHTFGLDHVPGSPDDPIIPHHVMSSPGARDFDHYFNFPDAAVTTEGGTVQNAHQYLTQTLGESASPWMAVLKPGVLSIRGSEAANVISVSQPAANKLDVTIAGTITHVDASNPGMNSINPFSAPLSVIDVLAKGGNDTVTIASSVTQIAQIFGGAGNDTLQGGSGADLLYGEAGADTLRGGSGSDYLNGGADNDRLYGDSGNDKLYGAAGNDYLSGGTGTDKLYGQDGNDDLWGGSGNDSLYGGEGQDDLYGEDGNDWLDGGDEWYNAMDNLFGGLGTDTFLQHKDLWGNYAEDFLADVASNEPVVFG